MSHFVLLAASPALVASVRSLLIPQMASAICAARLSDICDAPRVFDCLRRAGFGAASINELSWDARVAAYYSWKAPARFLMQTGCRQ